MAACEKCVFWRESEAVSEGQCLRYAPKPVDETVEWIWPWTSPLDWCGEFVDRESDRRERLGL